jgi:hypoxanthine phosphoribosyltransferase
VSHARIQPPEIVLDAAGLARHTDALAAAITADHADGVVLVGVLKGALVFLADLARRVQGIELCVDFLAISRYAPDSGRVRLLKDLDLEVTDRAVIIVEDLVDTGLTLAYLVEHVTGRGARSVDVCTLLDRAERRIVPLPLRYVGTEIAGDTFVLGYGLHYKERYRNLPFVVRADPGALAEDPDVYLSLYGPRDTKGANEARC